jgi:hypothetical protein
LSDGEWTLDPDSEANVLLPWALAPDRDPEIRERVEVWIGEMVKNPVGRGVEEPPGVHSVKVPGTDVAVVWTLNHEERVVILAHIGDAGPDPAPPWGSLRP